ncbi:class I SAM-dependent methyltransferase [Candidatus Parcubacteria bacterium]|nr:MAG: class I SAM-dependent methyltransferase [Candidatus Parcubacteria bacterium]
MKSEFDDYIEFYRQAQAHAIAISGEGEDYFARLRMELLARWFPNLGSGDAAILDFGASDGHMAGIAHARFGRARVVGVDPSARSIEYAKRHHPEIEFFVTDGAQLPFNDATFDLAYAVGVFHHIPFDAHDVAYREIIRTLKPGGAFVLFEMNPWNPVTRLVFARSAVDKHATMFSSRRAANRLRSYGTVDIRYYAYFPRILKFLRPLEPYLERVPLGALYAVITRPGR